MGSDPSHEAGLKTTFFAGGVRPHFCVPWSYLLILISRRWTTRGAAVHPRGLAFLFQLACGLERIQHHVVTFMTGVFVDVVAGIQPVGHMDRPWFGPRFWIVDGDVVAQFVLR